MSLVSYPQVQVELVSQVLEDIEGLGASQPQLIGEFLDVLPPVECEVGVECLDKGLASGEIDQALLVLEELEAHIADDRPKPHKRLPRW